MLTKTFFNSLLALKGGGPKKILWASNRKIWKRKSGVVAATNETARNSYE